MYMYGRRRLKGKNKLSEVKERTVFGSGAAVFRYVLHPQQDLRGERKAIQKLDGHGQSFGPLQVCYVSWNSIFGPDTMGLAVFL